MYNVAESKGLAPKRKKAAPKPKPEAVKEAEWGDVKTYQPRAKPAARRRN